MYKQLEKVLPLITKYLMQQADTTWRLIDNLDWITPLIVSVLALILVIWSTNKQIRNQNKQNNMPHLTIKDVSNFVETEDRRKRDIQYLDGIKLLTRKEENKKDATKRYFSENVTDRLFAICFKNIGYGVASDIVFYNINADTIIGAYKMGFGKGFATKEIAKDGCDKYLFEMKSFFESEYENDDYIELIVLYSDLNMNIRTLYVSVSFSYEGDLSYTFYQENSYKYTKKMKALNVRKRKLVKKYFERK